MLAFRPLTPSARSGNLIAGDGTKNGLFRSEQRTVSKTQTTISDQTANSEGKALNRKSPIQVRRNAGEPQETAMFDNRLGALSDLFSWWWGYWLPLRHRPGHAMRMPGPS